MSYKKGFTLIELLCVIVILAVIATVATTGIMTLSKNSKENLYCAKLEMLKVEAENYAKKYELELNKSTNTFEGYKSLTITVNDLLASGKIEPDKDDIVLNPLDNTSLNNQEIIIYLKNNQINIHIDDNNIC